MADHSSDRGGRQERTIAHEGEALVLSTSDTRQIPRRDEPVTVGVPFPRGLSKDPSSWALADFDGSMKPLQVRVLDRWSDGSVRWALFDFRASHGPGAPERYRVVTDGSPQMPQRTTAGSGGRTGWIDTGALRVEISEEGEIRCVPTGEEEARVLRLVATVDERDRDPLPVRLTAVACQEDGPLRACLRVEGVVGAASHPLHLFVRIHAWAGSPLLRIQMTLRNPARAVHQGGFWELGDPGSRYLEDFSLSVSLPTSRGEWSVECSTESGQVLERCELPFSLYQDSSGGEGWRSSNHINRDGIVPHVFRGYRVRSGARESRGLRATPVVRLTDGPQVVAVAQHHFWERFPKAVEASADRLRVGLLPGEFSDVHELQGGEQVTEEVVLAFGDDEVTSVPLDWVRDPLRVTASPEWYCRAEAMPYITPSRDDDPRYAALVQAALDGPAAFVRKREAVDEYGWRHFGDLYADHESVRHEGPEPLITHYNNQYDAAAGFAVQFFRSGDVRWLDLLEPLARHVIDIDIYHTTQDKPAYSGGLFWHTNHHVDAGRSTHRTYPRGPSAASGGPSAEHNYNTGLMLHHFLTGDPAAREAAIGLADWVIRMDDGRLTPLRVVSRAPTGLASASGSFAYHGPGRGAGNSIVALLNAWRLTGDRRYVGKAEELTRRCVHPEQDLDALDLLDAERRWYYTVFLQAVARYLDVKSERGELDGMYAYAQATLLHYARWMARHEYPYLEKPEILEFPTETWAAQDMRKRDVLCLAARHVEEPARTVFRERARYFFEASVSRLSAMPTRTFTRPVILMLTNGYMRGPEPEQSAPGGTVAGLDARHRPFVSQRSEAVRRLSVAAAMGVLLAIAAAIGLLFL
jgi:hypothetical protein